jgi:nicotinamidase-related amidase
MPLDLRTLVAPAHTALVLQEVQNGVVGTPSVLPQLAEAAARVGVVENCARLAAAARAVGVTVFHCTAETRDDLRGANKNARLFLGVGKAPVRLSPGSAAVQVPDAIGVAAEDVVLPRHHGLGPMTGTQLDSMLRNLGVTTFAFDAVNRGYQMVLPRDAVAGVPTEYADAVLDNTLNLVTILTTTADVVAAWQ